MLDTFERLSNSWDSLFLVLQAALPHPAPDRKAIHRGQDGLLAMEPISLIGPDASAVTAAEEIPGPLRRDHHLSPRLLAHLPPIVRPDEQRPGVFDV